MRELWAAPTGLVLCELWAAPAGLVLCELWAAPAGLVLRELWAAPTGLVLCELWAAPAGLVLCPVQPPQNFHQCPLQKFHQGTIDSRVCISRDWGALDITMHKIAPLQARAV